ncbi:four helix bundle protein [Nitratifractor sp.]
MRKLGDLQVYQISLQLSDRAWRVYRQIPRQFQFDIGSQFIRAVDSIGANIAEGYGRYHYRDSMKFYYNARGSLWESKHWLLLLYKRGFLEEGEFSEFLISIELLGKKLNNFIGRLKDAE